MCRRDAVPLPATAVQLLSQHEHAAVEEPGQMRRTVTPIRDRHPRPGATVAVPRPDKMLGPPARERLEPFAKLGQEVAGNRDKDARVSIEPFREDAGAFHAWYLSCLRGCTGAAPYLVQADVDADPVG
jgi:hypothetical protein